METKEHPISEVFEGLFPQREEVATPEPEKVEEPAAEPVEEVKSEAKAEDDDEPKEKIPYHQRPRFKKLEKEISDLRAQLEAKAAQPTAVDADMTHLVGNDPKAVEIFDKEVSKRVENVMKAREEAAALEKSNEEKSVKQFKEIQTSKLAEWEKATGIKFTDGEKTPEFKQIKKLIETGNLLTDTPNEYGHRIPDLDKAFAMWQAIHQEPEAPKVNPSKVVAAKMTGSGVASKSPKPSLLTPQQVRRMSLGQFLKSQK